MLRTKKAVTTETESLRPAIAYVFEGGGHAQSPLEEDLRSVRHAIALDTLAGFMGLARLGELDRVVLVTDRPALAAQVPDGVEVIDSADRPDGEPFHFGVFLAQRIALDRPALAMVLGGASAALCGPEDLRRFLALARENPGAVVQNNPQSPDIVAFSPATAALGIPLPTTDNALGQALQLAGLRRVLVENSARINFDVDTPTDVAILAGEPGAGPRTRRACAELDWVARLGPRLQAVEQVLAGEGGELALVGRVGPPVTAYLNMHLRCRLRVFSEERGMRALGRWPDRVVSLMGRLLDEVGAETFFRLLDGCAGAALIDSRVLMAHWRVPLSDADRFYSDIGQADQVTEPRLAAFTAAAWGASTPTLLGGHTLVYGGLWLLADRVIRRQYPAIS